MSKKPKTPKENNLILKRNTDQEIIIDDRMILKVFRIEKTKYGGSAYLIFTTIDGFPIKIDDGFPIKINGGLVIPFSLGKILTIDGEIIIQLKYVGEHKDGTGFIQLLFNAPPDVPIWRKEIYHGPGQKKIRS